MEGYIKEEEFTRFFLPYTEELKSLDTEVTKMIVLNASLIFDASRPWKGYKQKDNILEFPRMGEDEVPISVKYAVAYISANLYYEMINSVGGEINIETISEMSTTYFQKQHILEIGAVSANLYCSQLIKRILKIN